MARKNLDLNPSKAGKTGAPGTSAAAKAALAILGVGFVAGTTLVVGLDRVMKKIFVNEEWPEEEWTGDDWTEEDLNM